MIVSQKPTTRDSWNVPGGWETTKLTISPAGEIVGCTRDKGRVSAWWTPSPVFLGQVYRSLTGGVTTSLEPISEEDRDRLKNLILAQDRPLENEQC